MPVTKQSYSAVSPWTSVQLADLFRNAFIDAGLMNDWHASVSSNGIENRILRVQHNATKTYGSTFYWFQFSSANNGAFLQVATGWNTATNQPTGVQYLDYYSTATSNTSSHWQFLNATTAQSIGLDRYTSGVDTKQSWFLLRWGTSRFLFTITHPGSALQSWLNLDRGFYSGFASALLSTSSGRGMVAFQRGPGLRRELTLGCGLVGNTSASSYMASVVDQPLMGYAGVGHVANSTANYTASGPYIFLPVGFSATNPAYPENSSPIVHSLPYTPYLADPLPSDFGITFHYATNTFAAGDTFVVTAGVEEWEVLSFSSNASAINGASPLFLARMI